MIRILSFALPSRREFLAGGGATLLLAGCGSIIGPVTHQIYVLQPDAQPAAGGAPVKWQLVIAMPDVPASLDTDRIALSKTPDTLDYFANADWPDRVPQLVQQLLLEAFETSGRVPAVARDTAGLRADYLLQPEIRAFEAHYEAPDAAPRVVARIAVRLVKLPSRDIVGTFVAEREAAAAANNLGAIVRAFDQALGGVLAQIVDWALHTGSAT